MSQLKNLHSRMHYNKIFRTQQLHFTSSSKAPSGGMRVRISSFLAGFALTTSVGSYFFYYNFNDTAQQIKEGIYELNHKFQNDTKLLNSKIKKLEEKINAIENGNGN